jgi:hypothetical protein
VPAPEPPDGADPHADDAVEPAARTSPPSRPATRRELVALATIVALTLLGGGAAVVIRHLGGAPAASPSRPRASARYYVCIDVVAPQGGVADDGYCRRRVADLARRSDLTTEQRTRLAGDARRAGQAVLLPGLCAETLGDNLTGRALPGCAAGQLPGCADLPPPAAHPRSDDRLVPADADAVRVSLAEAGFPGAVARIARPEDPAPVGSLLFGVRIAEACFTGYLESLRGGGSYDLQGRLPGNHCLAP